MISGGCNGGVGIRSGLVWVVRLPVVYRLGDGWVALYGVVLSCGCGGWLGGVMVWGMSFYVMMWVWVMGCVVGGFVIVIDDAGLGLGWWVGGWVSMGA